MTPTHSVPNGGCEPRATAPASEGGHDAAPLRRGRRTARACAVVLAAVLLAGCAVGETFHQGQKITPEQLQQVPVGSSRQQVLLALGSPSTEGVAEGDVLYYISQTTRRPVGFLNPTVVDRRILAVYLDEDDRVREIAEYGLKDGKVFDYLARRTPTGGRDLAFVGQVLEGLASPGL